MYQSNISNIMIILIHLQAGEAASHYNPGYGRRTLLGENNEILSGRIAGANMTSSKPVPYNTDVVEE